MARRAKVYKTNKKKTKIATTPSPQIPRIQTAEERAQANHFNYRFRKEREDLMELL